MALDYMETFLGGSIPNSFMSWHPNDLEFRQVRGVIYLQRVRLRVRVGVGVGVGVRGEGWG